MGRVAYDRTLIRTGYRPYGMTNPFAAAQGLAGVSMHHGVFGPWRLAGDLGQSPPFTQRGGYALHGLGFLGDMVPDGSIVTYQGEWTSTQTQNATDVVNAIVAGINSNGSLAVRNVSADVGTMASIAESSWPYPLYAAPFKVTLQIQVTNGQGFGQPSHIASIVDHYVYQITGSMPLSSSVPTVQVPNSSTPTPTGQPGVVGAPPPGAATTDLTTWLEQNAFWIALGVGALVVLPKIL